MVQKLLLGCGIVASLLYVATTMVAPMLSDGYSSTSQTISELFAIDAPSTSLVVPLFLTYSLLMIAFGVGVWLYWWAMLPLPALVFGRMIRNAVRLAGRLSSKILEYKIGGKIPGRLEWLLCPVRGQTNRRIWERRAPGP